MFDKACKEPGHPEILRQNHETNPETHDETNIKTNPETNSETNIETNTDKLRARKKES